jgi:hypothetical protein
MRRHRASGFFTHEALAAIANTTLSNISAFERGECLENQVHVGAVHP